ncbi:MAG: phospho-N-acetylmuramoyl-pentapeptide-transferase [Agathobacter sp.]|nr:phospho-N-acetylmuramoyl-pentapeptide-transferase [Agathobacter sp.]
MFNYLGILDVPTMAFVGILFAFAASCFAIAKFNKFLPKDQGRQFAVEGAISEGKPRGAGIIFIFVFAISALLFGQLSVEMVIYLILIIIEMLTGYFDDAAEKPWGELIKGLLDLAVAVVVAVVFLYYNPSVVELAIFGTEFALPPIVFGLLTVVLVWASINVTNCADGVDGLSGTLTIISIMTMFLITNIRGISDGFTYTILLFSVCLLGYLWYNATPSRLLMGDAGSRAQGIFIAIVALKTHCPLIYLLAAIVLIVDGGIGLIKVSLLRFLKIHILKNTITPLHDHVRKNLGWSNAQVVFRFAIIQLIVSLATIYLVSMK